MTRMTAAAEEQAASAAEGDLASRFLERLTALVGAHAGAKAVFGDPVERDGLTVIPVARVRWGVGGGGGTGLDGSGTGGGGGVDVPGFGSSTRVISVSVSSSLGFIANALASSIGRHSRAIHRPRGSAANSKIVARGAFADAERLVLGRVRGADRRQGERRRPGAIAVSLA